MSGNRIYVYLRIRPRNAREKNSDLIVNYDMQDPKMLHLTGPGNKKYGFDGVFYDTTTQKNIFNNCILPVLKNVADGYQSAIMAYGQTGSGKTFTMRGKDSDPELKGVIPRVAGWLFDRKKDDPSLAVKVHLSYVQVYLGKPRDLLDPHNKAVPDFRIDGDNIDMVNVLREECQTYDKFMKRCDGAEQHKVVRATAMNPESSRGHSAMVIDISQSLDKGGVSAVVNGKLFLVDLAGYEQAALIGQGSPELVQETKHINETLLGLNRVMSALARKEKHIPYREYKLTLMLKDALSTRTKSTVMLMMSPANEYKAQTVNTLHFGQSAMAVKVKATLAVVSDWKAFAQKLKETMGHREERIRTLKTWFEKVSPKEMGMYCEKFGAIADDEIDEGTTDMEDILDMFKEAHVGLPEVNYDANVERFEDITAKEGLSDAELKKQVEAALVSRQNWAQHSIDEEINQMKATQAEELEEMIKNGGSAEEVAALKMEHAAEIKARMDMHFEHMETMGEQAEQAKATLSLKTVMSLKRLGSRAKMSFARKKADGTLGQGPPGQGSAVSATGGPPVADGDDGAGGASGSAGGGGDGGGGGGAGGSSTGVISRAEPNMTFSEIPMMGESEPTSGGSSSRISIGGIMGPNSSASSMSRGAPVRGVLKTFAPAEPAPAPAAAGAPAAGAPSGPMTVGLPDSARYGGVPICAQAPDPSGPPMTARCMSINHAGLQLFKMREAIEQLDKMDLPMSQKEPAIAALTKAIHSLTNTVHIAAA